MYVSPTHFSNGALSPRFGNHSASTVYICRRLFFTRAHVKVRSLSVYTREAPCTYIYSGRGGIHLHRATARVADDGYSSVAAYLFSRAHWRVRACVHIYIYITRAYTHDYGRWFFSLALAPTLSPSRDRDVYRYIYLYKRGKKGWWEDWQPARIFDRALCAQVAQMPVSRTHPRAPLFVGAFLPQIRCERGEDRANRAARVNSSLTMDFWKIRREREEEEGGAREDWSGSICALERRGSGETLFSPFSFAQCAPRDVGSLCVCVCGDRRGE